MSEILSAWKKSVIRGIERERSEKEHIIKSVSMIILIGLFVGGLIVLAASPVKLKGDFELNGNFIIPYKIAQNTTVNFTANKIRFQGEFEAPAYQVIRLLR